jgi:four helix bundle protein
MLRNSVANLSYRSIEQLVGCGGSIGANYAEANESESKKDFIHKIGIAKKEIKETKHWLRLLARANSEYTTELRILWQEAQELLLIFSKIIQTSRK